MMGSKKTALAAMAAALVAMLAACSNFSGNAEVINPSTPSNPSNTPSGVNLAKGCTVDQSSEQSGQEGPNLVDGDLSTEWSTSKTGDGWFTVDLGGVKQISMIKLYPSYANAGPLSFTLERSDDGSSWEKVIDSPVYTVPEDVTKCPPLILGGFSVSCRYLKVASKSDDKWPGWMAAYEFEVYK